MKMHESRRTVKNTLPGRDGSKMLSSFTESLPVMDWVRMFSIDNHPPLLRPEYDLLFVRLMKL